jgi:hypothetical protein
MVKCTYSIYQHFSLFKFYDKYLSNIWALWIICWLYIWTLRTVSLRMVTVENTLYLDTILSLYLFFDSMDNTYIIFIFALYGYHFLLYYDSMDNTYIIFIFALYGYHLLLYFDSMDNTYIIFKYALYGYNLLLYFDSMDITFLNLNSMDE